MNFEFRKSSLRVTYVMSLDPFGQQTFTTALPAARHNRAPGFGTHPRTEPVLAFACSLGGLVSAFHKTEQYLGAI